MHAVGCTGCMQFSAYRPLQIHINNGYILCIILTLSISTGMHTNCAAHRMHSCCNPLLHDMLHLTASAVSRIEPVVSRLQAAVAEVAVAKLLLVCLCCMTLCWVFSLPTTIPRYCVGGENTCIELYSTNRSRTQHSHLELLSCCHNPKDVWQGSFAVFVHVGLRSHHNSESLLWWDANLRVQRPQTKRTRTQLSCLFTACVPQSE